MTSQKNTKVYATEYGRAFESREFEVENLGYSLECLLPLEKLIEMAKLDPVLYKEPLVDAVWMHCCEDRLDAESIVDKWLYRTNEQ